MEINDADLNQNSELEKESLVIIELPQKDNCQETINIVSNIGSKAFLIIAIIALILTIRRHIKNKKNEEKKSIVLGIVLTVIFFCVSLVAWVVYLETNWINYSKVAEKPIIYLYPEEETNIEVKLGKKENITCSYPKYENGWKVVANPNGDLKYIENGKNLYALYYEAKTEKENKVEKEGFVVKGEDSAKFLEEKLEILGLNERESEEFIVYWLPKLEANKYNYIRFLNKEEIDENMPLEIEPKPDTQIRILMTFKGLNKEIKVEEQQLTRVERKGYTVVEWGGSEIK